MTALLKAIEEFEASYKPFLEQEFDRAKQEFLDKFPLSDLPSMPLESYALGLNNSQNSYSWWLEYGSLQLGSIKGGAASKHAIYFHAREQIWKYPSQFQNEQYALIQFRADLVSLIEQYQQGQYTPTELVTPFNVVRTKTLFIYTVGKLLPIYSLDHIRTFLRGLEVPQSEWVKLDVVECNELLYKHVKQLSKEISNWHPKKVERFLYQTFLPSNKYFKIAPGHQAEKWEECLKGGYISIGWPAVGDIRQYADEEQFMTAFRNSGMETHSAKATVKGQEVWQFFNLEPGMKIIANHGTSKILAIGTVTSPGYTFVAGEIYPHRMSVSWDEVFQPFKNIPEQKDWAFSTVKELSNKLIDTILDDSPVVHKSTYHVDDSTLGMFALLEESLTRKGQVILYGPPGTGKTHVARNFVQWKMDELAKRGVLPNGLSDLKNYEFCTFHPSFGYEDFIEGYRPTLGDQSQMSFVMEKGIFRNLCEAAQANPDVPHYLIIDEMNRGNIAKIFGELITLLEVDKRDMPLTLPMSKQSFSVPKNVFLIATMNTADRSIRTLDAAMRRRFAFIECMPSYDLLDAKIDRLDQTTGKLLEKLNQELVNIVGRDRQIGHSYFMQKGEPITTVADLRSAYAYEILPLVQEYCHDNYEWFAKIVGDDFVNVEEQSINQSIFEGANHEAFITALKKHMG